MPEVNRPLNAPAPRRIAFVHSALPAGGATIFLINLAGELVRREIPVHVRGVAAMHPLAADFARQHIPVSLGPARGVIYEDRIEGSLRDLARFRPDVIVANIDYVTGEVLRHAPPGVLRVGVVHSLGQLNATATYAGVMDRVVTVSEHVRDLLAEKLGVPAAQVHWVGMGMPLPEVAPRASLLGGQPLRLLYLGRLEDHAKRVRLFPAILARLKELGVPFHWTIAGEGPDRKFLESRMAGHGENQRVEFTGVVPYAEVPALLARHDIMLLTSDSETFSFSLHEGMAAGLVPVASDLPGPVRNAVSKEVGLLVAPENVAGYADAIAWLHGHREQMQSMSAKAREAIGREFSVATMTDRWLELLTVPTTAPPVWPETWKLPRPLFAPRSWRYARPVTFLRRLGTRAVAVIP